uniref:Uncharacterized protein n=1 Tax=Quercus lobata TaxID=97700 RepID=A0A7N2LS61_QUELO
MFDMIAQLLGFDKLIPPFATASDSDILQGVNYASGAAGICQEIGNQLGDCISFGGLWAVEESLGYSLTQY